MIQSMLYKATNSISRRDSGGGEANPTVDRFIEVFGERTLLVIVIFNYLATRDVRNRFPHIFGGIVSVPSHEVDVFSVVNLLVVVRLIDSIRGDLVEGVQK